MSKASEWARNYGERPSIKLGSGQCMAQVSTIGGFEYLETHDNRLFRMSPERALALAAWIIDTFGEPNEETRPDGGKFEQRP